VLDGGTSVLSDVAMVTKFAITGFVGYKFGCMIAIDRQFDSIGGVFSRLSYPTKT